ncbi:MAG TPA: DUF1553 domain-containing protein, partial [Pirellulaceae bacterium]|nr:DUF1553 domain-containing protein [Pirellulaceae bacterium]
DAPDGNQCTVQRDRSTTPLQALSLLNDPTIDDCAKMLGRRLRDESLDDDARLRTGFQSCVAREPSAEELDVLRELVKSQREAGADDEAVWRGVARSLLNLDETITRP